MSGEIVVPETPNWLQELEAKRERRLKVRLGHEAGAGAPCLKCEDSCPGLDLHFWRKCCKICKCPKEEHEVQDDDIYGWAQFQLLGSKPNKIKKKILLPGKKDEIDLDWVPKGHNDTIEKYLKTLPPEQLPVKGSQAAQDRKQLLQKQIPIHDIDPTLCHELTEDELKKMNEYIAHVKQSSAGVGQIVNLSSIIKGKLHLLHPTEAALLANRFGKGISISEIVKLQSQSQTSSLSQNLDKMSLKNKSLSQLNPNITTQTEDILNPLSSTRIRDKGYPIYNTEINESITNPKFSSGLVPKQLKVNQRNSPTVSGVDPTIDPKYLQNPNFDPKHRPSNFVNPSLHYSREASNETRYFSKDPLDYNSENSAFVPYQKLSSVPKSGDTYLEDNTLVNPNFAQNISGPNKNQHSINNPNYQGFDNMGQIYENLQDLKKSTNLPNYTPGKYHTYTETQSPLKVPKNMKDFAFSTYDASPTVSQTAQDNENGFKLGKYRQPGSYPEDLLNHSSGFRPIETGNYLHSSLPHQYNQSNQFQSINTSNSDNQHGILNPHKTYSGSSVPLNSGDGSVNHIQFDSQNPHLYLSHSTDHNGILNPSLSKYYLDKPGKLNSGDNDNNSAQLETLNPYSHSSNTGNQNESLNPDISKSYPGLHSSNSNVHPSQLETLNPNSSGVNSNSFNVSSPAGIGDQVNDPITSNSAVTGLRPGYIKSYNNVNIPNHNESSTKNYQQMTDAQFKDGQWPVNSKLSSGKKLLEFYPNDLNVNEDFVNPSQVNIGLIQDINYPDIKTATHEIGDFYEEYSPDSIKEILNNVILPDCHYCKKPFEENEFAVTIDRANALFHAGCFKCAGCNQILADNVYFYNKETENVYCLRDYAKIRGFPRCKACDELIFTKEYCLAENSTFHLKHFCCTECDMPLAGQDYLLEDEMPYCLPCFEQNKASKCSTCCNVIKPEELGCTLNGVHFHAVDTCFACKVCKKPLMGKKLLLRNNKLYCSHECYGVDK